MDELVQDIVALFNNPHWDKIKFHSEIYSVYVETPIPTVHITDVSLIFKDQDYKATKRNCDIYPIQLSVVFMGVEFFSIHQPEEFMP